MKIVARACVADTPDAVRAEVLIGGNVVASTSGTEPAETPGTVRFCFDAFDLPAAGLAAGKNVWSIRLWDRAGNSSITDEPRW